VKWTKECGERLRGVRKALGCSQERLANSVGRKASFIGSWERAESYGPPTKADVTALSAALGVTVPYLLCETNDPKGDWPDKKREVPLQRPLKEGKDYLRCTCEEDSGFISSTVHWVRCSSCSRDWKRTPEGWRGEALLSEVCFPPPPYQDEEAAAKVDAYVRQERRDKFARAALTGLLAAHNVNGRQSITINGEDLAKNARVVADYTIAELDR
jgi:transcriptional regulator with XRE-family HTH domain